MNIKQQILSNLSATYCRIQPSAVHGVGVFAVRDIPKGINPFPLMRQQKWYTFSASEIEHLDVEVRRMIDDFFTIEKDGSVEIPDCALNGIDITFFLNNSDTPNLASVDEGGYFTRAVTIRSVKKGEELTIAYNTFDQKYKK